MTGRSNPRHARRRKQCGPSTATVIGLLVCVVCFSAAFFLWKAALFGSGRNESGEEPFRPVVGDPPYRVCIDAGHGGSDPGARGVVEEKEMTAQTSEALLALLEADPNYIPLRSRESYDVTAKPSERAEAINAQSPQLLLSIHGNSAPEGSTAAGFEVLSVRSGPYMASGELLLRAAAGAGNAGRRRKASRPRRHPVHLLSGRGKAARREYPYRSKGRAKLYLVGRCKLSGGSGRTVLCDQRRGRCTVWQRRRL